MPFGRLAAAKIVQTQNGLRHFERDLEMCFVHTKNGISLFQSSYMMIGEGHVDGMVMRAGY
jgi:hypothetical protein